MRPAAGAMILALWLAACATPPPISPATVEGRALLEKAELQVEAKRFEEAYRTVVGARERFVSTTEEREAFRLAAVAFRRLWIQDRFANPGSEWHTSEETFMFEWLATFFQDQFPEQEALALFRAYPYSFYLEFAESDAGRAVLESWDFRAYEDNGTIRRVGLGPLDPERLSDL